MDGCSSKRVRESFKWLDAFIERASKLFEWLDVFTKRVSKSIEPLNISTERVIQPFERMHIVLNGYPGRSIGYKFLSNSFQTASNRNSVRKRNAVNARFRVTGHKKIIHRPEAEVLVHEIGNMENHSRP